MTRCACSPTTLTPIRFSGGVVLVRCSAHDVHTWSVDGDPVEPSAVMTLLKETFAGHRSPGAASAPAAASTPAVRVRRAKVVRLRKPAVDPAAGLDEQLTALLRSRGLEGSWAVA